MKRFGPLLLLLALALVSLGIGAGARYIEELRIGGGYGEAIDGGVDLESDGDIFADGNLTVVGAVTAGSFVGIPDPVDWNGVETITGDWVNTTVPWADNEVAANLTISGGTVNNTIIGGSTPAAGTFTTINSPTISAIVGDGSGYVAAERLVGAHFDVGALADYVRLEKQTMTAIRTYTLGTDADGYFVIADTEGTPGQLLTSSGSGIYTWLSSIGASLLGTDSVAADELAATPVVPGSYTTADITVDADGRITSAANGTAGAPDLTSIDTEAELETFLTDVTNVFTNNDVIPDANVSDTLTIGNASTMSSPPAIGGVAPAAGAFTTLTATGNIGSSGGNVYAGANNASYSLQAERDGGGGPLRGRLYNTGTAAGNSTFFGLACAGAYNPYFQLSSNLGTSAVYWSVGLDAAASNAFKMSNTYDLSAAKLTLTTAGALSISSTLDTSGVNLNSSSPSVWLHETDVADNNVRMTLNGSLLSFLKTTDANVSVGTLFNCTTAGTGTFAGDLTVSGGDLDLGVTGTTKGALDLFRGASTTNPARIMLQSSDGTLNYYFAANDGTLRRHTADPTANTDGTAVGSVAPAYATMDNASGTLATVDIVDTWYTLTGFAAGVTDGSKITIATSVMTIVEAGKYSVTLSGEIASGTLSDVVWFGISKNDAAVSTTSGNIYIKSTGAQPVQSMTKILSLAASDTLRVKLMNDTAANDIDYENVAVTVTRVGT